jgi:Bifunctional DNA primase/polymerase, N-terminal
VTPLDAALAYCEAGWSVIPARATGKRALVPWKCWQQTAPDPTQLAIWWRRWPRANVAVITGWVSGVIVVDVDPAHGGFDTLAALEAAHGRLPHAAVVETPSGGRHLYLAHPGGRIPNSAGQLGPGLDVRGDGGLALLPPSRRHGAAYRWVGLGGPATVPAMPAAWVELLRPPVPPERSTPQRGARPSGHPRDLARMHGLLDQLAQAPQGERNNRLHWCACRLRELLDQGAPQAWVELLVRAGVAAGLGEQECRRTVASGLKAAPR